MEGCAEGAKRRITMKLATIRNIFSIVILDGCRSSFDSKSFMMSIEDESTNVLFEFALIPCGISPLASSAERYDWSHEWLITYLRDVIGPPNPSNLAEVDGDTWVGWQAVTTLGDGTFQGTRCIISKELAGAARISFPIKRDQGVSRCVEIVENVAFGRTE